MHLSFRHRNRHVTAELRRGEGGWFHAVVDGRAFEVDGALVGPSTVRLVVDGRAQTAHVARVGDAIHVSIDGEVHVFTPEAAAAAGSAGPTLASPQITSPMPGKVLQLLVKEGQRVATGDGLLILEAMKMENRIVAEAAALVRKVHVTEGEMVDGGAVMLELEYEDESA
jgi:biotin carboxyl carrier protein